jgi:hypothetical protein
MSKDIIKDNKLKTKQKNILSNYRLVTETLDKLEALYV